MLICFISAAVLPNCMNNYYDKEHIYGYVSFSFEDHQEYLFFALAVHLNIQVQSP